MKNRIWFTLCVFVVVLSLTACDEEQPYENKDQNTRYTENDSMSEEVQEAEDTSENRDKEVAFLESEIVFYPVSQETFEGRLVEGHVVALIGTQAEWQKWLEEYMPEYTIQDQVFDHYNIELFKNNYLLIYQGALRQYGHKTTGVEKVFIENNDFRIQEFDLYNENLTIESPEQNHYITYHMCWIRKPGISEQIYEKYKVGHYYCVDGLSAYYVYMNIVKSCVETKYTHTGGTVWETEVLQTDEIDTGSSDVDAFFLNGEVGYVLHTTDAAAGHMGKYLWFTTDGGKNWRQVNTLTEQIYRYPRDMIFFTEEVGCIITDYVYSPDSNSQGYLLYRTEDGGKNWRGQTLGGCIQCTNTIRVVGIVRISQTEGKLYVMNTERQGEDGTGELVIKYYIYYTLDAGKSWFRINNTKMN